MLLLLKVVMMMHVVEMIQWWGVMAEIFIIIYKEIDIKSVNRVDNTFIFYCEYGYMKKLSLTIMVMSTDDQWESLPCVICTELFFSCVWIWCFEIFRCLFCALMTQILRTAAQRKVKWGSTIPSLGFSFCRFVITPGSLNHCLWIRSQHGNQSRIVLVSKLAAHGCAGFPPQHPLEFSAPHLHHLGWHSCAPTPALSLAGCGQTGRRIYAGEVSTSKIIIPAGV